MGAKILIFIVFFFQAHVLALDRGLRLKRGSCGESLISDHGTIGSPNYPSYYPAYSSCVWNIRVPGNSRMRLSFKAFQVESSSSCQFDYVEIRDGESASSELLGRFCGSTIPAPIMSSGNQVTIKFGTDGSGQYRGFQLSFEKIVTCGGDLTSDEGDVTSPNYPNNYDANEQCTWHIAVPRGYRVMLRFRSLQLESSYDCEADALEIYDGPNIYYPMIEKICGNTPDTEVMSSRNIMTLVFKSDGTANFRGFSAHYSKYRKVETMAISMAKRNIPVVSLAGTMVYFILLAYM